VTSAAYCRDNSPNSDVLGRWLKALELLQLARIRAREQRKRVRKPMSKDMDNKAIQAFWAMHAEALSWSKLTGQAYAKAHRISINSLRIRRTRLDADSLQVGQRSSRSRATIRNVGGTTKLDPLGDSLTDGASAARSAIDAQTGAASHTACSRDGSGTVGRQAPRRASAAKSRPAMMFTATASSSASAGANRVTLPPRWLPISNTTARVDARDDVVIL
jgi:hypothetical protein